MRGYVEHFDQWIKDDQLAIIRVIKTWGSSPRPVGSIMIVDGEGKIYGSVSGGCVEASVIKELKLLREKNSIRLLEYGIQDEKAWTVGLSCGGKLSLLAQIPGRGLKSKLFDSIRNEIAFIWLCSINESAPNDVLIYQDENRESELNAKALKLLKQRKNEIIEIEDKKIFVHTFPRRADALIIGAAHVSADLVRLAKEFGFNCIVIDPREYFTKNVHFSSPPDQIIRKYPSEAFKEIDLDQSSFAVILSHDPKIDDNALQVLLRKDIAYIGALGSRRTHQKTLNRLKAAGFTEEELNRIHAPIGLNINAKKPGEIALSIMAEMIKVKNEYL